MRFPRFHRRGVLVLAALGAATFTLAACSSNDVATPATEIETGTAIADPATTAPATDAATTDAPTSDAATSDAATTDAASSDAAASAAATEVAASVGVCPKADGSSPQTRKFPAEQPMCIDVAKTYTVTMETTKGTMTFVLDAKKAPKTVNNFVTLARFHYFDGISFHRVVQDFVIQGGDPEGTGTGGPGYTFDDELPDQGEYKIGSLAMANAGPNTNGSQFFIITGANGASLPPNYSLFGQLTGGEDVMKAINALGPAGQDGPPSEPVSMTKVTVAES